MNWQFQYPQAFYLLALVPLVLILFLLYRSWRRNRIRKIGDERLVKALFEGHSSKRVNTRLAAVLLAIAAGVIALANPRKPDASSTDMRRGIDIVIALDVSNSMLATDLPPDRITRAKNFINRLIETVGDDRLSLVVFAGNAYVQMPLTFDRGAARMYVAAAGPQAVTAQGTSLTEALNKSEVAFGEESERFKSIILITDGETHEEGALEKVEELAARGIMINTIGIGSPDGSTIVDPATGQPKTDESGQVVVSRLNEEILQQLAARTNGIYSRLETADPAVRAIQAQYVDIEKKALADTSLMNFKTYYHWLALPMLVLLLGEIFYSERKRKKA